MQTFPPSLANNVRLQQLSPYVNNTAYNHGFISLSFAEPSLGLPTGYTLTKPNSVYYFPIFTNDDGTGNISYATSRKFTGNDTLIFKNKNIGYNNTNPIFNFDINGSLRATEAYFETLSCTNLVPNSLGNALTATFPDGIFIKSPTFFKYDTKFTDLTANSITVTDIYPENYELIVTTTTNYYLYNITIDGYFHINGTLSANNVFSNSLSTISLTAESLFSDTLTANQITISENLTANQIYADSIYGKIDIDPQSSLYYNTNNQLSFLSKTNYVFAVRPSDSYSTDLLTQDRQEYGSWDSTNKIEDDFVLRPYFKSLNSVFDYVISKNLEGDTLTVYIDEDLILGGNNDYSLTGNITGGFYNTAHFIDHPELLVPGLSGGLYLWNKNNLADINGTFNYISIPQLRFNKLNIQGRYNLGGKIYDTTTYYSVSGRGFNESPRKLICRTYVSTVSTLSFGDFGADPTIWTKVKTKNIVQGKPIIFNANSKTETNISNLCFEINTNSFDCSGLTFNSGTYNISNVSLALLGTGVYSNAINLYNSSILNVKGENLLDPYYLNISNWNSWDVYGFNTPKYYPGYGIAFVANYDTPTILNDSFLNLDTGSSFNLIDYGVLSSDRTFGNRSLLNSSLILDGYFNAYNLYTLSNGSKVIHNDNVFISNNFVLSSLNINANNVLLASTFEMNLDPVNKSNFKFLNLLGSFNYFNFYAYGFTTWTFSLDEYKGRGISSQRYNSNISVYNAADDLYTFNPISSKIGSIDYSKLLNSIGHINIIQSDGNWANSTNSIINYNSPYQLKVYNQTTSDAVYRFKTPTPDTSFYTLSFYISSVE